MDEGHRLSCGLSFKDKSQGRRRGRRFRTRRQFIPFSPNGQERTVVFPNTVFTSKKKKKEKKREENPNHLTNLILMII